MEKLRLKNGTEFEMVPMGIKNEGNMRLFTFKTDITHEEIKTLLSDQNNIYDMSYITSDGNKTSFLDISSFISLTEDVINDTHTASFGVDKVTRDLNYLTLKVKSIDATVNPNIDFESCTLDELKEYKIAETKRCLGEFLESNPIKSNCHYGNEKSYAITLDKQNLLTGRILMTSFKQSQTEDVVYTSWNATGEECTYDWTLEMLQQLAFEIEAYVTIKVSIQQSLEARIKAATTKEEVLSIEISYIDVYEEEEVLEEVIEDETPETTE